MSSQPPAAAASAPDSGYVRIRDVSKKFDDFTAVDHVSLEIRRGEIFCLLGGSGSGKTTLLRMLAGFEAPTTGSIEIDGQDLSRVPPYERPVNMMFQSYALFPHMSVEKNVAFGLEQERLGRDAIRRQVGEILDIVKMGGFGARKPHQLSGGQRQRVALARALIRRPKVLLLDEPLSALDKKLREQTQFELMDLQCKVGITFIVVTHDQDEAMALATRIAVMDHGRVVAVGSPEELKRSIPGAHVRLHFADATDLDAAERALGGAFRRHDALTLEVPSDGGAIAVRDLLNRLGDTAAGIDDVSVHTPDLDDVFFALTGHATAPAATPETEKVL